MSAEWEELFDELAELDGAERARRLAEVERADPALARRLRDLLAADSGDFGELDAQPLVAQAPGFVAVALSESRPAADTPPGRVGERIGNYRLVSILGRGGMAEVWLAERADGEFDSRVAIKLVRPELGSEAILSGFLRERRILARLVHPGIARLLDGGRSQNGEPYFILEHVDGTPITDWCESRNLSLEDRVRLMIEVCEAVDHAHRSLVVHRDLKPSNVLVDASGRAKLLDFGIAKLLTLEPGAAPAESAITRLGARAFTPGYAAPEQITGEPVTTATDVYALGILLYEMLTGDKPFPRTARTLPSLMEELASEVFEPPSARLQRLGPAAQGAVPSRPARLQGDLDAIVTKALSREPERRYPGAAALADDLRRFLYRRPVKARHGGLAYRTHRLVSRHRLAAAAAALTLVSLLGGLTLALWQTRVAHGEARRAERARGILVSVFETLDPEQARSQAVTPSKLLDAGVRRVDRELADEPELQAEMLDLMANLHRKLGLLPEGRALAERSLALREKRFGADSAEVAQSLVTLGWIRLDQGDARPARDLLERAISRLEKIEGKDSLAAAEAREPLVEAVFIGWSAQEALPEAERQLAAYRRILGEGHEKTAMSWNDRGVVLQALGRLDEAEEAYRKSLAALGARLPPDDPRLGYPLHNLGDLLVDLGRLEESEANLRAAFELRRRSLGEQHPETAMSLAILGEVLIQRGKLGPAEEAFRRTLTILGDRDRFNEASVRLMLAQVLYRQSRLAESLAEHDRGIADLEALVGSRHVLVLAARGERTRTLFALGRREEAYAALHDALAALAAIGSNGREQRGVLLTLLGKEKRIEGRAAEAQTLHREARRLLLQLYRPDNFQVVALDCEIALDELALSPPGSDPASRAAAAARLAGLHDRLSLLIPTYPVLQELEARLAELAKP
ncbi:MAG TPA: hypothetical protein DD490_21875 [Acidobacteria bacterium]|nr:hypothetical protein [Acidobacteriota bacterium]